MYSQKQPNGKYRFYESYEDYMTGKIKYVSCTLDSNSKKNQKEAFVILQNKIEQIYANTLTQKPKNISMSKLVELYLLSQKQTVKLSTYNRNCHSCNTLIAIIGAETNVNRLSAAYIQKQLLDTGKEPGTLNEHLVRLKALLRWGYKHDLIQSLDFLNKLERFKDVPHRVKIEDKFIESSDLALLISGMKVDTWIDLTKFLALSGLRFGEAAALLFDDVDIKNRVIHVTKNYDYINHVTTSPKTLTSLRDVYMQDELAILCRKLKAASFATFAMQDMNAQKLLFCDSNGEHIKYYAYNKYFRENTLRVLGKAYTVHSLRHTHASLLLEQGVDVDSISRRLGHSDSTVTREIYLHITKKKQNQENLKIKELKLIAQ